MPSMQEDGNFRRRPEDIVAEERLRCAAREQFASERMQERLKVERQIDYADRQARKRKAAWIIGILVSLFAAHLLWSWVVEHKFRSKGVYPTQPTSGSDSSR